MANILLIDTTTKVCSVGVLNNDELTLLEYSSEQFSHSEKLHVMIQEVLDKAQISVNDLAAVAVSKGPGSYTGLRIGVSAAKGLCYALNIPLIAVDTLPAFAKAIQKREGKAGVYAALMDARRLEVYVAAVDSNGNTILPTQARVMDENPLEFDESPLYVFGDGAEKCLPFLPSAKLLQETASVRWIADEAQEKFSTEEFEDVAYFEPFYLKDFIAGKPKKVL